LLGFNGGGFEHDENNTLPSNIVILDEASMVNSSIFLALLKAIRKGSKVLIVFDYAQLPPIGAGNIATDLLQSDFSVNVLTKVHRQAEESGILSDANIIRTGKNPIEKPEYNMVRGNLKDMHYMFRMDKQEIFDLTIKYFMKSIETLSLDEVCICVPRKKDVLNSALKYNLKIQDLLLGNEPCYVDRGDKKYKLGAKVIQKVNNYEKQVVNGEVGYISDIDIMEKIFKVKYMDDKVIEYDFKELDQLELAYALTVHSTQGSQYHTVIIPLDMSSYMLLSKELIYTAITRAKELLVIVGNESVVNYMVNNVNTKTRNTGLKFKLLKYMELFKE
jgi:exodeoxyribonuclease V alpha subunit